MCEVVESFVPPNLAQPCLGDKGGDIVESVNGRACRAWEGRFFLTHQINRNMMR